MNNKTKFTIIATVFALVTISTLVLAQNRENEDSIKKEVKIEIIDGEEKVTIVTTKNGRKDIKVLTGKEADEYLSEHNDMSSSEAIINKKIIMDLDSNTDLEEMIDLSDFEDLSEKIQNEIEKIISEIDINAEDGNVSFSINDDENSEKVMIKIVSKKGESGNHIEDFDIDISVSKDSANIEEKNTTIKKVIIREKNN